MSIRDKDIFPGGKPPNIGRGIVLLILFMVGWITLVALGYKYGWW